ncbi:MAG: hypothetical protein GXO49_08445 [Chlorobi bacterium]|nr:hypothetical protein [Chlorobiota bacterium]
MKHFNEDFKTKLYETIEDIENNSLVEIVAVIKPKSGEYQNVSLWFASAAMFLTYTYFMFSPIIYNVYLIYFGTLFSFVLIYLIIELIKPLKRFLTKKKRLIRNTDIYARAVFQKGGIRFTNEKIGVLFYVSTFEQKVKIIADRGAFTLVPNEFWRQFKDNFNAIFDADNPADAFISELKKTKAIFAEYILPIENDINELPDDLEVEL